MKSIVSHIALLCGLTVFASVGQAQYPGAARFGTFGGGQQRPPVSPYLNLLTGGGDTAVNYYGLVRPQFAYNRAIQNLGSEINYLESPAAAQQNQTPFQTGNRSGFMTQNRYFMTNGYAGAGGYRPGAGVGGSPAAASSPAIPNTQVNPYQGVQR
jgi:hypothetical protein